ncbi:hypothetical protein GCM10010279_42180 [Streptomyces mutabilis]|nr:hypothetical protein GCM10010279_42180 [Streptomyces mutabilis]
MRRATAQGLRAEVAGPAHGTLGARVRAARKVPYRAVIGAREAAGGDLADVRLRDGRRPGRLSGAELLRRITDRVRARGPELWESA